MSSSFPEIFAIVRDTIRPPCLQVLMSYRVGHDWDRQYLNQSLYEVENVPLSERIQGGVSRAQTIPDRNIHVLRCRHSDSGETIQVNWWYTPFYLRSHTNTNTRIPILEFQTRAWIPTGYTPIPIQGNINEIMNAMERLQEDRLAEIRAREDSSSQRYINRYMNDFYQPRNQEDDYPHPRARTPPSLPYLRRNLRRSLSPTQAPPPVRVVEVEVPVERVIVQNKALPLPKEIGSILLSHARKGADLCPIAAIPFAECQKISVSSCFHVFDAASLARWQAEHTTCPVCRCKIENVVSEPSLDAVPTV